MTVGENIQAYRKKLGLSQEELGQKLLVSRQTISLWEKNQTVPTIDNLMRLKDIFGVSADEILGSYNCPQEENDTPDEHYRFIYTKSELREIWRLEKRGLTKNYIKFSISALFLTLIFGFSAAPDFITGFSFCVFLLGTFSFIKLTSGYNKMWKNQLERVSEQEYEYKVFDDYISIKIYRNNETIRQSKFQFADIERIKQLGNWIIFQFGGQSFFLRKSDLKSNSAFYSFMYKNPLKTVKNPVYNKWNIVSAVLFAASLLSIIGALGLVGMATHFNNKFNDNMWLFFLMTPIPVSSVIYGFVLKAKGYKYKKNIVAGIIMTFLLLIYGSFAFMF